MSTNSVIALAILAMIAIPIGVGYIVAFDETEKEGWQTGESYNLSDSILNAESPYFLPSTSPANNGLMYYPGFTYRESPEYFSTSTDVPSSLPLYDITSGRLPYNFTEVRSTTVASLTCTGDSITGGVSLIPLPASLYRIVAAGLTVNGISVDDSYIHVAPTDVSGTRQWIAYGGDFKPIVTASTLTITNSGGSFTFYEGTATTLSGNWNVNANVFDEDIPVWDLLMVAVTLSDDSVKYYTGNNIRASGLGSSVFVSVDGESVSFMDASSVVAYAGNYVYANVAEVTSTFADPSLGWAFPDGHAIWYNGQINESVVMYVSQPGLPTYFDLGIYSNIGEFSGDTISWDGQFQTFTVGGETKDLGQYTYMRLEITRDTVTVSGITAWPSMYTEPERLNTITFERENPSLIYGLEGETRDYNSNFRLHFRVDTTDVLAGYFPITRNYTLNVGGMFPNDDAFSFELTSIGVYGSQIVISGNAYDVVDGAIVVDGREFRLNGILITIAHGDGERIVSLNGQEIGTGNGYTIGFVGEWSVALRGYSMERVTTVSYEWQSGEFGLDKSGFTVVGLIVCAGTFLILGSTGSRSLSKALLLLIICGMGAWFFISWM